MPMFIRFDCVINSPLQVLIERLDDNTLYDASSATFVSIAGATAPPVTMFVPLQMNVPLPNVHAATVDTSDTTQFSSSSAFGYYVFNGRVRISDLQPLCWSGSRVVVTVDGQVVYSS